MANIDLSSSKIHSKPKVFISYSHDSDEHLAKVLELSEKLRKEGIDCAIDQFLKVPPEEGWPTWMEDKIEEADFVLMAFTETYLRRYRKKEVPDAGHGSAWETELIKNKLSCKIYDIFDFKDRETNKITGIGLTLSFIQRIDN